MVCVWRIWGVIRYDKWIAYGDGILLKEESRDTLKIVIEAVQTSVDQVLRGLQ